MELGVIPEIKLKEECYICGHLVLPKRMLAHIRSHTNVEIYECDVCGDRFASKNTLQKHFISHETHFVCQHCNKKFIDPDRLKSHRCFDSDEGYQCETCGKEFLQKSRLLRHVICHSESKPFECDLCQKKFRFKGNLTAHYSKHYVGEDDYYMRNILKEKSYACEICNKEFASKRNLERHVRSHTSEKPYVCEICNRGFALKHNMETHARLHTNNDKPYQCDRCSKCFNRRSNLKVHIRMHIRRDNGAPLRSAPKEKTQFCAICGKGFTCSRNLDRHQVTHTKEKPYECQFCFMKFAYDSCLRRHSFLHTEGAFKKRPRYKKGKQPCHVCNVIFIDESKLKAHKKEYLCPKNYKCCKCFQTFQTKKRLREHHKVHINEEKPLVCHIKAEDIYSIKEESTSWDSDKTLVSGLSSS